ncbi:MAG: hypothetical protein MUE94_11555 [Verrucomicrobia bacterium]|nr:hypothetical protein [Verrucomicrobiota bacterium]
MNNPLLILQTLDRHLDHAVELTLYGRAALALGFPAHEARHETTQDVDAIIPLAQLVQLRADEQFWNARDATNAELAAHDLYLTHLFTEADVFLLPDWLNRRVPIVSSFTHLKLLRPATLDLILTKMMRGADPEDLSDIEFLLKHEPRPAAELRIAFNRVRMPDMQELRDAFRAAQPKVLALAEAREFGGLKTG